MLAMLCYNDQLLDVEHNEPSSSRDWREVLTLLLQSSHPLFAEFVATESRSKAVTQMDMHNNSIRPSDI